jgi:hypothetical protein
VTGLNHKHQVFAGSHVTRAFVRVERVAQKRFGNAELFAQLQQFVVARAGDINPAVVLAEQ